MIAKTKNYAVVAEVYGLWSLWATNVSKHEADFLAETSAGNLHVVTQATGRRLSGKPVGDEPFVAYRRGPHLAKYTVRAEG